MAQDTSSKKLKAGHKYGRLQRYETLSKEQKKVLKQFGKPVKAEKFKTPETMKRGLEFLQRGITQGPPISPTEQAGQGFLQNLLSRTPEQQYQTFAQPFMRQFQEQTVPQLAERFSGLGAQRSSAFGQALGGAGAGLQENLAALKGNLINQMLGQQLQGANVGLGYSQLPGQRFGQQLQATQLGIPSSLLPQEMQQRLNQNAQQQQYQQRMGILGTQPWGTAMIAPQGREGFWSQFAPSLAAAGGSALGSSLFSGLGSMGGNWLSGLFGGGSKGMIEAPQVSPGFFG
jgi:hypothetical protein